MEPPHASGPYCEECERHFKNTGALKAHTAFKHDGFNARTRPMGPFAKESEPKPPPKKDRQPRPKVTPVGSSAMDDLEAQVGAFHNLVAFLVSLTGRPAMAQTLVEDTPNIAHQWRLWAEANPTVERGLQYITTAAGGFAVAASYLRTVQVGMIESQQRRFARESQATAAEAQPAEEPFSRDDDQAQYEYVPNGAEPAETGAATTY